MARRLLGCRLVAAPGQADEVVLRLVEVEAYGGTDDPASHAARGPTPRTRVMHGPPGRAYVYRSYGLHWCLNVVAEDDGTAGAVLLRAAEVVSGAGTARRRREGARRQGAAPVADLDLARGPGRLCAATGVTGEDDGADLHDPGGRLRLVAQALPAEGGVALPPGGVVALPDRDVVAGPRIGISRATEQPWRLHLAGERTVSGPRGRR